LLLIFLSFAVKFLKLKISPFKANLFVLSSMFICFLLTKAKKQHLLAELNQQLKAVVFFSFIYP